MTTGKIEFTFETTSNDWIRFQSELEKLRSRDHYLLGYLLADKMTKNLVNILGSLVAVLALIYFLLDLLTRNRDELLDIAAMLSLVMVGYALWMLWSNLKQFMVKTVVTEGPWRPGREGVDWGTQQLLATPDSLRVNLSACHSVYDWRAFSGLKKSKDMVLLLITPISGVMVPRRAFKSEVEENEFCDYFRRHASS